MTSYDPLTPCRLPPMQRRHRFWYGRSARYVRQRIRFWRTTSRRLPKLFNFRQGRKS